jgi:hypothetical protein
MTTATRKTTEQTNNQNNEVSPAEVRERKAQTITAGK